MNYLKKFPDGEDKLKLLTPVLGLVTFSLGAACLRLETATDLFFLLIAIFSFIFSTGLLICKFFDFVNETKNSYWIWADMIIHGGFSFFLGVGWILCMVNIFALWSLLTGGLVAARFFLTAFMSMLVGFYGLIAWMKFKKIKAEPTPHTTVT